MKTYDLIYTRESRDRIRKFDSPARAIIQNALESLKVNPFRGKPLSYQLSGLRSFRTSDYRIIYIIRDGELIILVITIGHRRDIYKTLKSQLKKEIV